MLFLAPSLRPIHGYYVSGIVQVISLRPIPEYHVSGIVQVISLRPIPEYYVSARYSSSYLSPSYP